VNWFCVKCVRNSLSFIFCISQGSVATCLRCGEEYSNSFIARLLLILAVKRFKKSVKTCWSYECVFLTHSVDEWSHCHQEKQQAKLCVTFREKAKLICYYVLSKSVWSVWLEFSPTDKTESVTVASNLPLLTTKTPISSHTIPLLTFTAGIDRTSWDWLIDWAWFYVCANTI